MSFPILRDSHIDHHFHRNDPEGKTGLCLSRILDELIDSIDQVLLSLVRIEIHLEKNEIHLV